MINNESKTTNFNTPVPLIAGVMPNDSNIEFFANRKNHTTLWLQNGSVRYFTDLPVKYFELLNEEYKENPTAVAFLSKVTKNYSRQIELFAYYFFGDLDDTPDILNEKLQRAENFRESKKCPSLLWERKSITINNIPLTRRELLITDMINDDLPDKAIASAIGICLSWYDEIKRKLFKKAGVCTKTAFLKVAIQQKVAL